MARALRVLYRILVPILIFVCGAIAVWYGWLGYATCTGRPGLYGSLHSYYALGQLQFSIYCFGIALGALGFAILCFRAIVFSKTKHLPKIIWLFLLFAIFWAIAEIYLQTRFISTP